jgi:hypothetical protein
VRERETETYSSLFNSYFEDKLFFIIFSDKTIVQMHVRKKEKKSKGV